MKKIKPLFLPACVGLLLLSALTVFSAPARADLTIMPVRILFTDRDRSAEVTLVNSSQKTNTYRLSWVFNHQQENGTYNKLEQPLDVAVFDHREAVIFSPRQVTVPPGGQQRVRLSLRRPADLPDGEYRAHLVLQKVSSSSRRNAELGEEGMGARLSVNVGFSIPVIVRQGAYDAQVKISDIKLNPPANPGEDPYMTLSLNRTGKHSVGGRILVFWAQPGGKEEQIGILNNINVFHESPRRTVNIALTNTAPLNSGMLRVVYEGIESERGIKFDEQTLPIQ